MRNHIDQFEDTKTVLQIVTVLEFLDICFIILQWMNL